MVLNYYSKSVRNFLPEAAAALLGKNKYIYALEMFIKAIAWVFFSVFRHYFASISSDSSFSTQNNGACNIKINYTYRYPG